MESLDRDTVALLSRRAFDVAASTRGVKVLLNGKRLPIKTFKDYVELCLKVQLRRHFCVHDLLKHYFSEKRELNASTCEVFRFP